MTSIAILALAVAVVFLVFLLKAGGVRFAPSYQKTGNLFTDAERNFLRALDRAVGNDARVFGKVRVADVLSVRKGINSRSNWTAFARISGKHFDYVLCDPENLIVLCVIELNDKSHQRRDRRERDQLLRRACVEAGMPLIEVTAARQYEIEKLGGIIGQFIGKNPDAYDPGYVLKSYAKPDSEVTCGRCGAPMVEREVKKGPNAGTKFLGCSAYPRCRFAKDVPQSGDNEIRSSEKIKSA